ncbi:MAG: hypothetical protein E7Z66_04175 [Thermoplasmata archaeon]|nr:hypothetical protein [Thermoplasmata archaeon]
MVKMSNIVRFINGFEKDYIDWIIYPTMLQVAIYGKGGIGKSTISANISYELARRGNSVLQIGCDPKHDSTRLLLEGKTQRTVLEYLRSVPKENRKLEDVLYKGSAGVNCIEAGGPEPGVGCAGRGILSMFDFLDRNGIGEENYDYKLYDVLGDVVCGGFAVPLRKKYADAVYIVTSGEFMSMYAANNILKGLLNYNDGRPRVGGLILNSRGMKGEYEYVKNFADGVGLPIIAVIPRDPLFSQAESQGKTLSELYRDSDAFRELSKVVDDIELTKQDVTRLFFPKPLDENSMDLVAKGIPLKESTAMNYQRIRNKVDACRSLHSCAGAGAVYYLTWIRGIHIIIHGPTSCAYMMCYLGDSRTVERDIYGGMESEWDYVSCTNLDDSSSVFGGTEKLESLIRERASKGDEVIFVISMCVPGIIGDNITDLCSRLSKELNVRVVALPVDGIGVGGATTGRDMAVEEIIKLIEPCDAKDSGLINILGDYRSRWEYLKFLDESVEELLSMAGLKVNTVYPGKCTLNDIRNMGKAKIAVRAQDDITFAESERKMCEASGVMMMSEPLPRSMSSIERWLDEVSEINSKDLSDVKAEIRRRYESEMLKIRKKTEGKRVLIITNPSVKRPWMYELLEDLGIEVLKHRKSTINRWILGTAESENSKPYTSDDTLEDIDGLNPDLVLTDSQSDLYIQFRVGVISQPSAGLNGIIDYAKRLSMLFETPVLEIWRQPL